jgi:hypothetical protein
VERLKKFIPKEPESLIMVAFPAVDLLKKLIVQPLLKMDTLLPAVALFENRSVPGLKPLGSLAITKFCVIPELFVTPTPLMVRVNPGLAVMV